MIASMRYCRLSTAAMAAILIGCSSSLESLSDGQQAQSTISPDEVTRAFVWIPKLSGGLGATVSQPYQVWIENTQLTSKVLVVEVYKTDGVRLSWKSISTLEVCYAEARIYKFLNGADFATEQSPEIKSVEIVLKRVQNLDMC